MSIWQKPISVDILTQSHLKTAVNHLGIVFTEVGEDTISAKMPMNPQTHQPFGLLHGGLNVVLAETLGSCGAYYSCPAGFHTVGLEVNANHLRGVREGWVHGTTKAFHIGQSTHVWSIEIFDDQGRLSCISRITMLILKDRT
jgi:uncharacterized protein (TIGR00369 family)